MATHISIHSEKDITNAIETILNVTATMGFNKTKRSMVATAVSELSRNMLNYAKQGEITYNAIHEEKKSGIQITAKDKGPGIEDTRLALQDHYSSGKSLGIGLPGTKRLMDDFHIHTEQGVGTEIIVKKWI